jgi:hypothetical protein
MVNFQPGNIGVIPLGGKLTKTSAGTPCGTLVIVNAAAIPAMSNRVEGFGG